MNEHYEKTGTFGPLLNKKKYSPDEEMVLKHFFTNTDKNIYCATDAMDSNLWAFLVGQYSRAELSMRDRFLRIFNDIEQKTTEGKIQGNDFLPLDQFAKQLKNNSGAALGEFKKKAAMFLFEWGVDYGHNSLKDADTIRMAVENISQVSTKVIESPFPALGNFQEKSTRYLSYAAENIMLTPELANSQFGDEIKEANNMLISTYQKFLPIIREHVEKSGIIKKGDCESDRAFKNILDAKAFDIARYLLPSGVLTSLGASFSTRTLETHLSEMLSHPLSEIRGIGQSIYKESMKLSPGLLTHVKPNKYLEQSRISNQAVANYIFAENNGGLENSIIKGIHDNQRVELIKTDDIDLLVTASILFEASRQKGISFSQCYGKAHHMSDKQKDAVISAALKDRGTHDRMPRAIQHGTSLFEITADFGAYRDFQRQRASKQIWQGVTAIHGYDYPEMIEKIPNDFKKEYDKVMTHVTELARKVQLAHPHHSEYVAALGHVVRTTHEMDPGQLAYVIELRTTPQGHHSYRRIFQQVYSIMKEKAPLFMKHVRVNQNPESNRMTEANRAAIKQRILDNI